MSIALSEFWTRLVREGIAQASDCKRMANAYADAHSGSPASDSGSLAEFLVGAGELTSFQARCLTSSSAIEIRYGDYVQSTDEVTVPLSHWLTVQDLNTRQDGYLIRVGPGQFTESRFQWLLAHAGVQCPTLQAFVVRGSIPQGIDIFSPLPGGRSLCEMTRQKKRVEKRQALTVGIAVADALVAMHARSLVHGAVRADRVWLTHQGQAILLRDPSGPPTAPRDDQSAAWIDVTESPGAYAAPEFSDPAFASNELTDIYGLGCLLFRMVVGRLPVEAPTVESAIAAHATEAPPELADAIQQGESGDPTLRVIAYAMAKSPAARFASAQQLGDALRAVLAMSDDGAASKSKIAKTKPTQKSTTTDTVPPPVESPPASVTSAAATAAPPKVNSSPAKQASPPPVQRPGKASSPQQSSPQQSSPQQSSPAPPSSKSAGSKSPGAKQDRQQSGVSTKTPVKTPGKTPQEALPQDAKPPQESSGAKERTPTAAGSAKAKTKPSTKSGQADPAGAPVSPPVAPPAAPPMAAQSSTKSAASQNSPPPAIATPPAPSADKPASSLAINAASKQAVTSEVTTKADGEKPVRRRRKKKKSPVPLVLGVLCVPVLMLIIGLIVRGSGGSQAKKPRNRPPIPDVVPSVGQAKRTDGGDTQQPPVPVAPEGYELVDDDNLLWVPPYGSDTPVASLALLPPGPSVIVSVQLSKMLQDPVGTSVIDALSPELKRLIDSAASRAKVPAESIGRCTVALHAGKDGWPSVSLAIELTEPLPIKELSDKWQATMSRTKDGATVYAGDEADGDVYYLGDSDNGAVASDATVKRFAIGSADQISEVALNEGGAIPLPPLLAKVWKQSSSESEFVAMITPNFLFADGRQMLLTSAPQLAEPLKKMLIPEVASLLVSATTSDDYLYTEFCAIPSGDVTEAQLLRKISDSFKSWPEWSESFLQESVPDASWRLLATRMPFMLRFVVDHTRFGVSEGVVVANSYLPANAASQITLATVLAMNTKAGGAGSPAAVTEKPLTAQEMLARNMSIDFDQLSLEFAINGIIEQFAADLPSSSTMMKVTIKYGDLEKKAITQNLQIRDFKKTDLPLRKVLTDLLDVADPDQTATGPKDPNHSLIWVLVENAQSPSGYEILVTTRDAAAGVYELPEEFRPDE